MRLSQGKLLQLKKLIVECVEKLYNNDGMLISNGGMEQSVSFKFAIYLLDAMKRIDWLNKLDLDIEYNKNGLAPKRIPRRPNGVRPDLIIHRRGNNDENFLVVEIKGWWNKKTRQKDQIKLEDFTHQEGEYKYGLGAFIELRKNGCDPVFYTHGRIQVKKQIPVLADI